MNRPGLLAGVLVFLVAPVALIAADPAELTPEQRKKLGKKATEVSGQAVQFYQAGQYSRATELLREALKMRQQLYPRDKYPQGHPNLAESPNNLGLLLQAQGEYARAEPFYRDAVQMYGQLYPKDKYPQGHPHLAHSLNNLAALLRDRGEYAKAEPFYRDALQMRRQLYPKDKYPQGHPDLATSLNNLATLLNDQGEYARAEPFVRDALQMYGQLYPKDTYPQGHPDLAHNLNDLGALLQAQEEYAKAETFYRDALRMKQAHFLRLADLVAETEALNFAVTQALTLDLFLSTTRRLPAPAPVYPFVWEAKGALAKIQQRRHLDLLASRDQETAKLGRQLLETRQRLARLLLSAPRVPAEHAKAVQQLTDEKEDREKRLARQLLTTPAAVDKTGPDQLRDRLPADTAFIDLFRYSDFGHDPKVPGRQGWKNTLCYVAFVVRPGQAVARVELGEAAPIEQAWTAWHSALTSGRPDRDAAALARLVWQPLRAQLPDKVRTVWLAPDAELLRVPWAALPGIKPNTILLEEHAVAVVPHGAFLLNVSPRSTPCPTARAPCWPSAVSPTTRPPATCSDPRKKSSSAPRPSATSKWSGSSSTAPTASGSRSSPWPAKRCTANRWTARPPPPAPPSCSPTCPRCATPTWPPTAS